MYNHFIVLHVGDFEMASQKVVFCMDLYEQPLSPSLPSFHEHRSRKVFVEFCRMSEGAEHNGLASSVNRKPLLGTLFCCQKRTHYAS